jgi:hypothetical protein
MGAPVLINGTRYKPVELIDEVKRLDCTFAWIYARRPQADDRQGGRN